jgi:hypothetical protein
MYNPLQRCSSPLASPSRRDWMMHKLQHRESSMEGMVRGLRCLMTKLTIKSIARRSTNAAMGAHSGAIQRSTRAYTAWICRIVIRVGFVRRW